MAFRSLYACVSLLKCVFALYLQGGSIHRHQFYLIQLDSSNLVLVEYHHLIRMLLSFFAGSKFVSFGAF